MTNAVEEKKQEKVCVVICNWNRVQEPLNCIDSVLKSNYFNFDLVLVDNGSDPQYLVEIKKRLHPFVTLIENERNEGGTVGFNRGMQYALDCGIYDSILLLDNDVVVDPTCLTELIKELRKSSENAIIGPMVLWMDFPDLLQEFGAYFDRNEIYDYLHLKNYPLKKVDKAVISVDYVISCCLLVDSAKLKKVGLMDPGYFLYCDDADWCMQFVRAGYEVKATSSAKVWHKGGGANKTSGVPRYYYWRSITYFYLHNMDTISDIERYVDKFLIKRVSAALFMALKTGKVNAFKTVINAIVDSFSGVRGKIKEGRTFLLDACKYGSDFSDSIKEMIVISDVTVPDEFIQSFLKTQKHLLLPVQYYGGYHTENFEEETESEFLEFVSQESAFKTILVLCGHILTQPNQHEEVLHTILLKSGDGVYFIDPFDNLFRGFAKVRQIREEYKSLLNTANIFRNELVRFVKQKYVEFFKPLVSVIMPSFNQADFLVEAISSVQRQTYSNIEIVVVNDGSTDHTADILKTLSEQDQRIRYFSQENKGMAAAINKAIKEARGEYVVFLDSDDIYEPEKIEKQLAMLQQDKSIDLIYTAIQVIDKNGKPLMHMHGSDIHPDTFLAQMLFRNIIPNPTTIMGKRDCFVDVPYREKYKHSMDYDFVLRLAQKFRFKYLDLSLTRWRRYDRNMSNELAKCKIEQRDVLKEYDVDVLMSYVEKAKLDVSEKLLLKGNILYNLEMWEAALEKFKEIKSPTGDFYCGNCLFKMKNAKEAIGRYRQCLQHNPNHAACWNNLGVALGDGVEAEECFKKALQLRPEYLDPQCNLSHSSKRFTDRELRQELIPYNLS